MDQSSDAPQSSLPANGRSVRRWLFVTFTTMVGLAGVGLLATYSYAVYRVDCIGSLGYLFPLNLFGVAALIVCGLCFLGANSTNGWTYRGAAIAAIFAIPAIFFLVVNPMAAKHRACRHVEQMAEKIPILNGIVAHVDDTIARQGHAPVDNTEFNRLIFDDQLSEDLWDGLGCCWGIRYNRADSGSYRLQYSASDVLFVYDSSTPELGWHAAPSDSER